MISSFDLNKLNYLLQDFYNLTHIRITVFDDSFHELAAYPEQISPFCKLIRSDVNGQRECSLCDENACKTAAKRHSPYTYCCHAGLTESIEWAKTTHSTRFANSTMIGIAISVRSIKIKNSFQRLSGISLLIMIAPTSVR